MKLVKKLFLLTIVLVVMLGALGYLAIVNIDAVVARYREPIERWVSEQLGGRVVVGTIGVKLLPRPRIDVEEVALHLDGTAPAFAAARVGIDFELAPLLWRSLKLNAVSIEEPILRLERDAAGTRLRGSASSPAGSSGGPGLFVGLDRFEIRGGRVAVAELSTGTTESIDGIDLTGGLRFEDGELRVSPLSVERATIPRLGVFSGEFSELRSSVKSDRGSLILTDGGFEKVRFSGEGEWRVAERAARFQVNGVKTGISELLSFIETVSGRALRGELSGVTYSGTAEPKFTVELGGEGGYRINGSVGVDGTSVTYRDVAVEQIRGVAKVALSEREGRIALESFRGAVGAGRASVSLEGGVDLMPVGGEIRITVAALPLSEVKRFLPEPEGYGVALTNGVVGGKITYRLGDEPRWNLTADLREGGGTVRGVAFQDGVGKFRVEGGGPFPEVFLENLTLGFAGGAEAVVVKGEFRGGRGSGSVSALKLGVPTAIALLGIELPGWSDLAGDLRVDVKGRYEGGAMIAQGPLGISGGAGRWGEYQLNGVNGELHLQSDNERKLLARELRFALNGEPFVFRGNVVSGANGIRFERCNLSGLGGDVALDGTIAESEPRRVELTGRGRGVAIESVQKLLGKDAADGALTGELSDIRWRLSGVLGENFERSLEGGVAFRLEKGALRGVNIGRIAVEKLASIPLVRDLLVGAIPGEYRPYFDAPDTPIHSLTGEIDLAGGRASTQELRLESDLFGLGGQGGYEFGGGVDLGATLWLERRFAYSLAERVRELRGLFGPEGTIAMPLRITGAPTELSVTPDIGALVARAARGVVEREAERFIDRAIERLTDQGGESYDGQYDDGQ